MKHLIKLFVITFFLTTSTHVLAEQKIVVMDMKYILNNSKAGKGAQEFLKKRFTANIKKYTDMENSLKKEESDLLSKRNVLTNEEYTKKVNELRKKVIDFQTEKRTTDDKNTALWAKLRKTLLKEIEPILEAYINENNVSLVIEKKNIVGGSKEYDITKIIIEKLDAQVPSIDLK